MTPDAAAETRSPHFGREAAASTYRDIHLPRIFAPWARVLLELVPVRPGEAVLDVATGPGTVARVAAALAGPSGRVVGVDISPAMLAIGRAWTPEAGAAPIEYLEASASSMPVPDAAFDVAYCQQGLQHMADPLAALREMRRALKPAGRIGLAVWVRSPFGVFRDVLASLGVRSDGPQPSEFGRDPAELAGVLREMGFKDVQVQSRELVGVLEGGIPQALEVAEATGAGVALVEASPEQAAAIRQAITRALEPSVRQDGLHLASVANIASAHL
jgi:ubiquinone/menaquinone biosynthesis C-methylase UbiE